MYEILKTLHSWWAYVVLIVLVVAIVNAFLGYFLGKKYQPKDLRIGLFGLIVTHIQLLLGGILYFVSPLFGGWSALGMGVMKDSNFRKMLVEHPFGVILGVVLITLGWSWHKKQKTDKGAFSKIGIFYAIGLVLILGVLPWGAWLNF